MLIQAQNTALSGLIAQTRRLSNVAHNTANVQTYGPVQSSRAGLQGTQTSGNPVSNRPTHPVDTVLSSVSSGSVRAETVARNPSHTVMAAPNHPDANGEGLIAVPNISIVEEQVTALSAARAYKANAHIVKVTDRLLDVTIQSVSNSAHQSKSNEDK